MINKLTGEPVSEEMQNVLKRLAVNEAVPESEIYALKEIKEANSCISSSKPTIELRNRTGIQLGVYNRLQNMGSAVTKSDGAVSFSGEIRREKRLDIVIGLPASGKSSALVEPISELYESRVIDSDEAKKLLPEFNNGWGAGVVHKESQLISDRQLSAALKAGENITYPRVGGDSSELLNIISTAKKLGYSVYVHYNELDRNKALGRLLNRFLETGRYIKPELVTKYGSGISNTYEQAKKATTLVDGFSKWSNDVPFGSRPKLLEYNASCEDMVRAFKPTLSERLEESESKCRILRAKIDDTIKGIVMELNSLFSMLIELLTNDSLLQSATSTVPDLVSAIKATSLTLCVMFFLIDFFTKTLHFQWVTWENVMMLFLKMVAAKICVDNSEFFTTVIYNGFNSFVNEISGTITQYSFIDTSDWQVAAQYFVSSSQASQIINNTDAGFLNFQPLILNMQISIQGLIMKIIMIIANVVVIARLFELTVYTMIAPVPLSTFACDSLSDIGKGFLKSYAAVTLQSIVLAIMFIAYAAVNNALIAGRIGSYNLALDGIMGLITTLTLGIGVMSSGAWAKRIVGSS